MCCLSRVASTVKRTQVEFISDTRIAREEWKLYGIMTPFPSLFCLLLRGRAKANACVLVAFQLFFPGSQREVVVCSNGMLEACKNEKISFLLYFALNRFEKVFLSVKLIFCLARHLFHLAAVARGKAAVVLRFYGATALKNAQLGATAFSHLSSLIDDTLKRSKSSDK